MFTAIYAFDNSFTNIVTNHSIRVTFAINTYTITASAGGGASSGEATTGSAGAASVGAER